MTIIAGFQCSDGIVVCADTQETSGSFKRSVPKLQFFSGPVWNGEKSINPDLALAVCGAGDGPFVDKITSQAWHVVCEATDIWDAARRIETMIKETYKEFAQIYQPGSMPTAEFIYGITIGGFSKLFQACGPVVNEKEYASSGIGYYLADFLAGRMYGRHLNSRQCVILAAYILFQAKEHVEGCGGDSHIVVLRETETSGYVEWKLILKTTEYLKLADQRLGEILLESSNFSGIDSDLDQNVDATLREMKEIRKLFAEELDDHKRFARLYSLFGVPRQTDDLGLPIKQSDSQTSGDQQSPYGEEYPETKSESDDD